MTLIWETSGVEIQRFAIPTDVIFHLHLIEPSFEIPPSTPSVSQ